jgi:hypothetical protein
MNEIVGQIVHTMATTKSTEQQTGLSFLMIFLFLAAGIPAIGVFSYRIYEQRFRTQVERQLSAIAELKTNELVRWRTERQADGESFFNNSAFGGLVRRFFPNRRTWMCAVNFNHG